MASKDAQAKKAKSKSKGKSDKKGKKTAQDAGEDTKDTIRVEHLNYKVTSSERCLHYHFNKLQLFLRSVSLLGPEYSAKLSPFALSH